jgi:hypothetical protein
VFCALLATILCLSVLLAEARPLEQIKAAIAAPTLMQNGRSSRMHVVYRHDKHLSANCLTCHHKGLPEQDVFLSCADAACHPDADLAARTEKSYYLALHRLDSQRSCRGCHLTASAKYPGLDGCQTCHSALPPAKPQGD